MRTTILIALLLIAGGATTAELGCSATARSLHLACGFEAKDDYLTSLAACADDEADEFDECAAEFSGQLAESRTQCTKVFAARLEVCEALADAAHEPEFGAAFAANFVDPRDIGDGVEPNPWFPLVEGNTWVYRGVFEEDGETVTEIITVTVTGKVKTIDGIECVVVIDVAEKDEAVIEITDDWYAQDTEGNVWYCGELSQNFETFDGDDPEAAELVDIDGSWKSGRDHAKAGILFPKAPVVGSVIRQEVAWTDAEDVIEILSLSGGESSPVASCKGACLVTRDFTPLAPDANENKYFAAGIGLIAEIKPDADERIELIEFELN